MTTTNPRITASTLAAIDIFRTLPGPAREQICPAFRAHFVARDKPVIKQRDPNHDVYFLVSGVVRVRYYSSSGKEISFRDLGPGTMFGELSTIDGQPRSAEVTAREQSFIVSANRRTFMDLLHAHPEIADYVLRHLATSVRMLTERVIEYSTLSVKNRIHIELLRLASDTPGVPHQGAVIRSTHAEIANKVSTTREAVTREINELIHLNILERKKRSTPLVVKDLKRLEELVRNSIDELPAH